MSITSNLPTGNCSAPSARLRTSPTARAHRLQGEEDPLECSHVGTDMEYSSHPDPAISTEPHEETRYDVWSQGFTAVQIPSKRHLPLRVDPRRTRRDTKEILDTVFGRFFRRGHPRTMPPRRNRSHLTGYEKGATGREIGMLGKRTGRPVAKEIGTVPIN